MNSKQFNSFDEIVESLAEMSRQEPNARELLNDTIGRARAIQRERNLLGAQLDMDFAEIGKTVKNLRSFIKDNPMFIQGYFTDRMLNELEEKARDYRPEEGDKIIDGELYTTRDRSTFSKTCTLSENTSSTFVDSFDDYYKRVGNQDFWGDKHPGDITDDEWSYYPEVVHEIECGDSGCEVCGDGSIDTLDPVIIPYLSVVPGSYQGVGYPPDGYVFTNPPLLNNPFVHIPPFEIRKRSAPFPFDGWQEAIDPTLMPDDPRKAGPWTHFNVRVVPEPAGQQTIEDFIAAREAANKKAEEKKMNHTLDIGDAFAGGKPSTPESKFVLLSIKHSKRKAMIRFSEIAAVVDLQPDCSGCQIFLNGTDTPFEADVDFDIFTKELTK